MEYKRQVIELMTLILVFLATNPVQSLRLISPSHQERMLANSINKSVVMSFQTSYGDIFDCVEIYKQPAFDHPLLRHHSIQMEPSVNITKLINRAEKKTTTQVIPNNVECPLGSVPIKRVPKQDLLQTKSLVMDGDEELEQIAALLVPANISEIHGRLNVWQPNAQMKQFSAAYIYAASQDGSVSNIVSVGWAVNTYDYTENYTRLFGFWTKDSEKTSGCIDVRCPGFVQVSRKITLGMRIQEVSTYDGPQHDIVLDLAQDHSTRNWWVTFGTEKVGYYPKELFTTLVNGGTRGGWGGQVNTPPNESYPALGSGHFPNEGFQKSCYISDMKMVDISGKLIDPDQTKLKEYNTKPECFKVSYIGYSDPGLGNHMFLGGPPTCKP
ncbi:uncharacterized protein LOC130804867 isoform X1 [Amaranthus tricolor]|uniref:uncharacterized protein LOC130804867 isoform X1 n=1 Tax=Amaranthus tricolor TaxID=29722 RepID=UPI002590BAD0|nr:uncharacterized protein LOC130804867 isoform X1 [Amaranthus tricolor]